MQSKESLLIKLSLDWLPNTNHSGILAAWQKGWYKEAGLELEIQTTTHESGPNSPGYLLGAGHFDVAVSATEALVPLRAAGLPIVSVAAITQHLTTAIVTLAESGLSHPAQLAGKRYAAYGEPFEPVVLRQVLQVGGASSLDYQTVEPGPYNVWETLLKGQADFVLGYMSWEGLRYQYHGHKLNVFYLRDYGLLDYYSPILTANQNALQAKPDAFRTFLAVTAQGYQFAATNVDETADLLITAAARLGQPITDDQAFIVQSLEWLAPRYLDDAPYWGYQTAERWSAYPQLLREAGLLTTPLDSDSLFTNDFLPK